MKQFLPMNLQFFSENNPPGTDPPAGNTPPPATPPANEEDTPPANTPPAVQKKGEQDPPKTPPAKTYTEKQYNDMMVTQLNAGIEKAMKEAGFEGKTKKDFEENLKNFKKWQDDQKTEAEKQAEALALAKQGEQDALAELTKLRQADTVRKSGVAENFVGYVAYEVSQLAGAKGIEFDVALAGFIEEHGEQYKAVAETGTGTGHTVKVSTGGKKDNESPKNEFDFSQFAKF